MYVRGNFIHRSSDNQIIRIRINSQDVDMEKFKCITCYMRKIKLILVILITEPLSRYYELVLSHLIFKKL